MLLIWRLDIVLALLDVAFPILITFFRSLKMVTDSIGCHIDPLFSHSIYI